MDSRECDGNGPKKIYETLEPDPSTAGPVRVEATYRFEYPGSNLNTESLFVVGGRLAVVAKTNPTASTRSPRPCPAQAPIGCPPPVASTSAPG